LNKRLNLAGSNVRLGSSAAENFVQGPSVIKVTYLENPSVKSFVKYLKIIQAASSWVYQGGHKRMHVSREKGGLQ